MTLPTRPTDSVTTIHQRFYNASLPPITLEFLNLTSLTTRSVSDLVATLGAEGSRLGIAASYGRKCVLGTLAFSTETRVLLIVINNRSKDTNRQKQILKNKLLCNPSLEKHGFFMERIAAALRLDLGLCISNAFDITSSGDRRGSMASYKSVIVRGRAQHSVNEPAVEKIFTEQAFVPSRKDGFALRAWACYVGVQGLPNNPQGVIDTSSKSAKVRSEPSLAFSVNLTRLLGRSWIGCANASAMPTVWTP